jgi:hypothetical protein
MEFGLGDIGSYSIDVGRLSTKSGLRITILIINIGFKLNRIGKSNGSTNYIQSSKYLVR